MPTQAQTNTDDAGGKCDDDGDGHGDADEAEEDDNNHTK